ncbi:hypothetical protein [Deefgea piscis]|uniref:hypothetical protein n=1 Tax=Deefgea piscis TaxID=2739061 RepID=UPI001C7E44A9|nr:hypothetical protein [Deefgea piscis]QZA80806.1 hypothetical protein K4H25_15135 [Deefgea piscis]
MDNKLQAQLAEYIGENNLPHLLIAQYPRIIEKITLLWGSPELANFLDEILFDSRCDREGFTPNVAHELFVIQGIHAQAMGLDKETAIWGYDASLRTEDSFRK